MMTPDDVRELEEHRADFRALRDRVERLSETPLLIAAGDGFAGEIGEVSTELEAWERALSGEPHGVVIVVTGGRGFNDRGFVYRSLDRVHAERHIRLLVQGGAPGADALAKAWADERGVPCETEAARWEDVDRPGAVVRKRRDGTLYDAAAGSIRNGVMLEKWKPHGVVAFPGGTGTADCCRQAEARGLTPWRPRV